MVGALVPLSSRDLIVFALLWVLPLVVLLPQRGFGLASGILGVFLALIHLSSLFPEFKKTQFVLKLLGLDQCRELDPEQERVIGLSNRKIGVQIS